MTNEMTGEMPILAELAAIYEEAANEGVRFRALRDATCGRTASVSDAGLEELKRLVDSGGPRDRKRHYAERVLALYARHRANARGQRTYTADQIAVERTAWARLVRAERAYIGSGMSGGTVRALDDYEAAKQALRDLGVDVDALLEGS